MIIDCHTHIGKGETLNDVYQIDLTLEMLIKQMDKAKVVKSILFPVYYRDYRKACLEIAEIIQKDNRFLGFVRVNCGASDAPEQIEYGIKELGLKGLKIHPADGFPTREMMEKVSILKIPVLFHTGIGGHAPVGFEPIIKSYPDVTIILAHLGLDLNGALMFEFGVQANFLARKYKNVYLDTAAVHWISYFLEQAIFEAGADKIIFGTDAPWFHQAPAIAFINDIEVSDTDKMKILGGNIARILNL